MRHAHTNRFGVSKLSPANRQPVRLRPLSILSSAQQALTREDTHWASESLDSAIPSAFVFRPRRFRWEALSAAEVYRQIRLVGPRSNRPTLFKHRE